MKEKYEFEIEWNEQGQSTAKLTGPGMTEPVSITPAPPELLAAKNAINRETK